MIEPMSAAPEPQEPSPQLLDTVPNPQSDRDYVLHIRIPEFTCLCPCTGQPDFAELELVYVPDALCVEFKSLKFYTWSYRNHGFFHEAVTNRFLNDLAAVLQPRFMRLTAHFNVRGGLYTTITAEHRKPGWQAADPVALPVATLARPP